jgi:hypothetical protein
VAVVWGYDTCEAGGPTPDHELTSASGDEEQLLDELNRRRAAEVEMRAFPAADPACPTEEEAQAHLDELQPQLEQLGLRLADEGMQDDPADGDFIGPRCWNVGVTWSSGFAFLAWQGAGYFENNPDDVPT